MKIAGIDLAGPRNVAETCLSIFEEGAGQLQFVESHAGLDDLQILEVLGQLGHAARIAVGIDAPLSYSTQGGDRPSDKALRQLVRQRSRTVGIIAPMAPRMTFLTLHGISLTRLLESRTLKVDVQIVEVHPGACMLLGGAQPALVESYKRDPSARVRLCAWLKTQAMAGLPPAAEYTDHFVDSCAAALAAWKWALGKPAWRHAAAPPLHPYDFAC
jgi:predicted nuclease with RNAse H fold